MRTTLIIEDELFVSVKKLAAERGSSVSGVVVEALRGFMNNGHHFAERAKFVMPTFDGGGERIDTTPVEFHQLEEDSELAPFQR